MKNIKYLIAIISMVFVGCDNNNNIEFANIYMKNGLKTVEVNIDEKSIGIFDKYKNVEIKLPLGEHIISQELDLGKNNKFDIGSKLIFKQIVKLSHKNEKVTVNLNTNIYELSDNLKYVPSDFVISQTKNLLEKYPILKTKALIKISKDSNGNGNTIFFNIDDNGYRWKMLSNSPFYDLNNKNLENTGVLVEIPNGFGIALSSTQKKDFNNIKIINDGKCFQTNINKSDKIDTFCQLEIQK